MQTKRRLPIDSDTALLAEIREAASTLETADRRHYPGWFRALLVKAGRTSLSLSKIAEASGVTTMTLAKWVREAEPQPAFRRLQVLANTDSKESVEPQPKSRTSGIEIHFSEGFHLLLSDGMTPGDVASLVFALRLGARP